jgi:hypothetical protein
MTQEGPNHKRQRLEEVDYEDDRYQPIFIVCTVDHFFKHDYTGDLFMSRTAALEDLVDFAKKHSYIEDTPTTLGELISKVNNVCMNLEEFALIKINKLKS